MAIKIGVINQKGGVGKTTISNAIAYESAKINNYRTLLIDFDPQSSQTILFNLEPKNYTKNHESNLAKIFEKVTVKPLKIFENLDFLPSNLELSSQSESTVVGKDKMLQKYLHKIEADYDVIIIDSNPSFSALMTNVILSSDHLLIPIGTSALDEAGAQMFFEIIENIADIYDKYPEKIFVVPTKFDKRRNDDREVLAILQEDLPQYVQSLDNLKKAFFEVLPPVPEKAVAKDASAARLFLRDYIETYAKNQKDFISIFSNILTKITDGIQKPSESVEVLKISNDKPKKAKVKALK